MTDLKLNLVGKTYLSHLIKQMKDLKIFITGDVELLLEDCALNYQLYRESLLLSLIEEKTYNHMKAMRFLKVVQDFSKQLGIGPLQRHKLKAFKEINESTIMDSIEKMMDED